jgi:hypothetical protein
VLEGRKSAVAVFILFAFLGVWSWATITVNHHVTRDPIYLGGLLFAIFISISVAYRSPLRVDRIAFGAAAVAFLLATFATTVPLGPATMLVVMGAKSVMWTVATVVGLMVMVRGSENVRKR